MRFSLNYLHECVRNEDNVHAVEDGGDDGMPETDLSFEILKRKIVLTLALNLQLQFWFQLNQ